MDGDELYFVRAGVHYSRQRDGSIQAHGPNDAALRARQHEAVARRVPMLRDLKQARTAVVAARRAAGLPMATRHDAECLPEGICETCGEGLAVILTSRDKTRTLRTGLGGGMCHQCLIARWKALKEAS